MPWNGTATCGCLWHEIRKREKGMTDKPDRAKALFHYLNYAKEILAW
jgi:hypothetical protein